MKQKFKGEILTTAKTVNNILQIYNKAEDHNDWYLDTHRFAEKLSFNYNIELPKICGIISALSPLKSWDENKRITELYLHTGRVKHTKMFKGKADAILNGTGEVDEIADILNGNKITSFFLNILNPMCNQYVTIDRHAISICVGESLTSNSSLQITTGQYEFFVNCYKIASHKVGVLPLKMQSVTWVKWRELKEEKKNIEVPF